MRALEIGKTYLNGDGRKVAIAGYARPDGRDCEHIVWSYSGDWYCAHSGRFVWTHAESGAMFCRIQEGYRDL